ncbi:hypothetical protein DPMN_179272 [Dreissena polymorpha]|uniref:Uncharacterized protein n=1 Tax=Dreissena polymorpha TaxID=45954 RepID=A0A9D4EET9_DREPO|nr:hypothetical protein DPMN_179272 [Dreissena polymorpha]
MMRHCDNVVAIALAERLGGSTGYELMLGAIKQSLLFSFVNNATTYAPYCVKLLYHHYNAGYFHTNLKYTLFSTPFKGSSKNFACDTKREMDHLNAIKGFRSISNINLVTCRLSLIDSLNETRQQRSTNYLEVMEDVDDVSDKLEFELTEVDMNHILPTTALILRRGGLSMDSSQLPVNVYTKVPFVLPAAILDELSMDVGKYLLFRYASKVLPRTDADVPSVDEITGHTELVSRAKRSKGVTIKRTMKSKIQPVKTEKQIREDKRQKHLEKETRKLDSMLSENSSCQAIVKPDGSKPKVFQSLGMQRALKSLITSCALGDETNHVDQCMRLNLPAVPTSVYSCMKICTMEFAGMKFKAGHSKSGKEYLQHVERVIADIKSKHQPFRP